MIMIWKGKPSKSSAAAEDFEIRFVIIFFEPAAVNN